MKKMVFIGIVALLGMATAQAQDSSAHRYGFRDRPHRGHMQRGHMERGNLTDDQRAKLKTINDSFRKSMRDLYQQDDITVKEWRSRMEELKSKHREEVSSVVGTENGRQSHQYGRKGMQHRGYRGGGTRENLSQALDLSAKQQEALKKSRTETRKKIAALQENDKLSREEKRKSMQSIRKAQQEAFRSMLTKEQLEKLEQMKQHQPRHRMAR